MRNLLSFGKVIEMGEFVGGKKISELRDELNLCCFRSFTFEVKLHHHH